MKQLEENYSHTALIDWGADEFSLLHHKRHDTQNGLLYRPSISYKYFQPMSSLTKPSGKPGQRNMKCFIICRVKFLFKGRPLENLYSHKSPNENYKYS
jgi:hypothetical protein